MLDKYKLMPEGQAVRHAFSQGFGRIQTVLRRIALRNSLFPNAIQTLKSENKVDGGSGLELVPRKIMVQRKATLALTCPKKSLQEILTVMKSDHHMNRLYKGMLVVGRQWLQACQGALL